MNLINRTISRAVLALGVLAFAGISAFGQATMTQTTLSAAINNYQRTLTVASATGINAPGNPISVSEIGSPQGNAAYTMLYIDREAFQVLAVSGTTVTVARGYQGTTQNAHVSGATVWVGPPEYFGNQYYGNNIGPSGACTASLQRVLPLIVPTTGGQYTCGSSGQWIQLNGTQTRVAAGCTGTAGSAETEYLNGVACSGATSATLRQVVVTPGTLASLQVFSSANVVGGSGKDVLTVYKNGSATALTCTIAGAAATCSDTTHSVAVAAGDVLTFQFVSATSDTAANVTAAVAVY
jgi:hypothetical protein